jgi:hypothetical protein
MFLDDGNFDWIMHKNSVLDEIKATERMERINRTAVKALGKNKSTILN